MDKPSRPRRKLSNLLIIKNKNAAHYHVFDMAKIIGSMGIEDRNKLIEEQQTKEQVKNIYQQLQGLGVLEQWLVVKPKAEFTAFRGVFGSTNPLDTTGTVSCGGRLNIGGAQVCNTYGNLCSRPSSGLYMSMKISTVLAEMDLPSRESAPKIMLPNLYRISYNDKRGNIRLFDLDKVFSYLDKNIKSPIPISSLSSLSPIGAEWKLQKTPSISQIIAEWLRKSDQADGIITRSFKDMDGSNFFLFFHSIEETLNSLTAEKIDSIDW